MSTEHTSKRRNTLVTDFEEQLSAHLESLKATNAALQEELTEYREALTSIRARQAVFDEIEALESANETLSNNIKSAKKTLAGFNEKVKSLPGTCFAKPAATEAKVPFSFGTRRAESDKEKSKAPYECSGCGRGMSGPGQASVWDNSLGRHVTHLSTRCDSCNRGGVTAF